MGILDLLLESVPNAPGAGFGPVGAGAGTAASGAAAGPPMCPSPGPDDSGDDGPDDNRPNETRDERPDGSPDLDDGRDHSPEGTYTPRYPALSWEALADADADYYDDGSSSGPASPPTGDGGGDSIFYPQRGPASYVTMRGLEAVSDWVDRGDGPWGRSLRGLLSPLAVVPLAILQCGEHTIRNPGTP